MNLPKKQSAMEPGDYRQMTVINAHYKFLAFILANHLRQPLTTAMHSANYCGLPGRTIFDAISVIVTSCINNV